MNWCSPGKRKTAIACCPLLETHYALRVHSMIMSRKYISKVLGAGFYMLQYGCIAHCFVEYVAELIVCDGPSMEPTIFPNNILISEHITTRLCQFNRGDIVIVRSPKDPKQFLCKRIVGMPGDRIKARWTHDVVPRGHLWVEGDNKNNSTDSRDYGPIPQGLVRGRVLCRIWPLDSIQRLTSTPKDTSSSSIQKSH